MIKIKKWGGYFISDPIMLRPKYGTCRICKAFDPFCAACAKL